MQNAIHDGQAGNDASNQGFQPVIQVKSLGLPTEAERAGDQEVNWTDYYDVEMVDAQVQTLMTADNLGCDETTCTVAAQQPGRVVSLVGEWKPVQLVNLLVGRRVRGEPEIRPTCWLGREGTVRRLPCYPDRWTVDFGKGVLYGFEADELEVQVCEAESYNWHEVVSTASKASQAGTCSDFSSHTGQTAQAIEQSTVAVQTFLEQADAATQLWAEETNNAACQACTPFFSAPVGQAGSGTVRAKQTVTLDEAINQCHRGFLYVGQELQALDR